MTTYSYDGENQLIGVSRPGLTATYRYDSLGRRIEKTVNGVITRYVYDSEDILTELDGTNQVVARYTHGPGIDEPLSMLRQGQVFFYHPDGLGSVWDLTDSTGTATQSYTYDSFGNLLASPGTVSQPYTYTGREFDVETGLYYYRARYYDPSVGRFLQEDPLGLLAEGAESGMTSLYAYVANNPLTALDPSGLQIILLPEKCGSSLPSPEVMKKLECIDKCNGSLPVFITSGSRTPAQNKCAGGAANSRHLGGKAADITIPGMNSSEVAALASACSFNGVSTYDPAKGGHTHVDVRSRPWNGHNGEDWQPKGQVPPWREEGKCKCNP